MGWSQWRRLGGEIQGAPAVVIAGGVFDVYVRGMDDLLWQNWFVNGEWSGWHRHDDPAFELHSAPTVVAAGDDHRAVYAVGNDGNLWCWTWLASRGWAPTWTRISHKVTDEAPAVLNIGDGGTVYATSWDGTMHYANFRGRNPGPNQDIEWFIDDDREPLGSRPSVVSFGPTHRDVYARDNGSHMALSLKHKWWNGSQWSAWEDLGGGITDAPSAVIAGDAVDVYCRGHNNVLTQKWWNGEWSEWHDHDDDFKLGSAPCVVSQHADHRDVYCRGQDGAVHHKWWKP